MPCIHIRLEAQLVKPHLDTLMQRYGIGAKWSDLPALDNLKVETLTREVIMVVLILIGILQPIYILIPASALCLVADLCRE